MRKQITLLYALVIILIVSQIASTTLLIIKIETLSQNLNQTQTELKSEQMETLGKISQITESINSLQSSQSSLAQQLAETKASTSSDFSGIIENSLPSVVTIITDVAQGTGFIISPEGYIVTNAHVLSNAHYANAITSNKQSLSSSLIGYDNTLDIALLKVSGNFKALELYDSDNIKIGEKVIAIGNPLGLSFSATEGIISAINRKGSNDLPIYIQTDVALNPGNSGGPLINTQGKVIGINNFKIGGSEGIGFALESNYIKQAIDDIALKALNETII